MLRILAIQAPAFPGMKVLSILWDNSLFMKRFSKTQKLETTAPPFWRLDNLSILEATIDSEGIEIMDEKQNTVDREGLVWFSSVGRFLLHAAQFVNVRMRCLRVIFWRIIHFSWRNFQTLKNWSVFRGSTIKWPSRINYSCTGRVWTRHADVRRDRVWSPPASVRVSWSLPLPWSFLDTANVQAGR
jgi:hypothetical protein